MTTASPSDNRKARLRNPCAANPGHNDQHQDSGGQGKTPPVPGRAKPVARKSGGRPARAQAHSRLRGSSAVLRGTAAQLLVCGSCAGDLDGLFAALPHPAGRSAARRPKQSEVSPDMVGSSPVQTLIILGATARPGGAICHPGLQGARNDCLTGADADLGLSQESRPVPSQIHLARRNRRRRRLGHAPRSPSAARMSATSARAL